LTNEIKISALELCEQFIAGEIHKTTIQTFAEKLIIDIEEQTDDEILIDTLYEWEDEELNYPITKQNIQLWKLRLETGEDKLAYYNNWNLHIEPQKEICQKYKSDWSPVNKKWTIGINIRENEFPINGLRHPKSNGNEGWYLRTGEYQEKHDFFKPICIEHLLQLNPMVIKYLGLKEEYRFLIYNKGYEDVWFDKQLLNIEIDKQ